MKFLLVRWSRYLDSLARPEAASPLGGPALGAPGEKGFGLVRAWVFRAYLAGCLEARSAEKQLVDSTLAFTLIL